ncbi:MAG: universal stress protein [Candidatus Humimicrobiaceae bacterium]
MINSILVGLDGSKYDEFTENRSLEIAETFSSKIYGFHSYQAIMHRTRFENMEPTLPDNYQNEDKLNYLRDKHEDLINLGMEKISLGYLKNLKEKAAKKELEYYPIVQEGRNYIKLIEEGRKNLYDLLIIGSSGMGSEPLGSIAEKTIWLLKNQNLLITKTDQKYSNNSFLVCIDGSKYSGNAVHVASDFAKKFNANLFIVTVYDVNLHKPVFCKVKNSLTSEEQKSFKFTDQEKLHDDIIDKGLEEIYKSYLDDALELAKVNYDIEAKGVLLTGKAENEIVSWTKNNYPQAVFIGRFGRHREEVSPIGSTASYLSRNLNCDLFIVNENLDYQGDLKREAIEITWDYESEEELKKAPSFIRPMIKKMVERYAFKKGVNHISKNIFIEAKKKIMK